MKKTLQVPVKYINGDKLFTIKQVQKNITCHICEGVGTIRYNSKNMRCPECMGAKAFKSNKSINVVVEEPCIVTKTTIKIEDNKDIVVKYQLKNICNTFNRDEEELFLTKEDAQKKCDELNAEIVYINTSEIIIQDAFKETCPSIEKIQNKLNYFKNTNEFESNIVINKNNVLLDGYINYLICKMLNIETVKAVVK